MTSRGGAELDSPESMKTQIGFSGFLSVSSSNNIVRQYLILLLCAMPLTAMAQSTTTPSAPAPVAAPTIAENLSVTPKFGQTAEQLAADRAECQGWAKGQTGFDPGQYGGGVAPSVYTSRRQQYGRAVAACLEGHGYNVHFAAPVAPPSPPAPPLAATPTVVRYSPPARPELKYHPFTVQIDGGYTLTTGSTGHELQDGPNAGLGLTWFPTSTLPIGIRVDGSYSWFRAKDSLLNAGNFSSGHENIYGGDADLQLNLAHRSSATQFYLFGGAGQYREETLLRRVSIVNGTICGFFYCEPGYFPAVTAEQRSTSDWHHAWNAGAGLEVAIADRASFFVEARYLRILPNSNQTKFIPIRFGFRF
jgi:opacity protein-like surface antigen